MKAIGGGIGSDMARDCWPTLAGRGCREFFGRPTAWLFAPLLAIARGADCERLVMALLAIMEAMARGLVHARVLLTAAVLTTARHSIISWEERRIDVQALASEKPLAASIEAYDQPTLSSSSSSNVDNRRLCPGCMPAPCY